MSTLESILSGEGASASEPQATPTATPETTREQPQGQPEPSSNDEPQTDERGMVPVAALQATCPVTKTIFPSRYHMPDCAV